MVSNTKSDNLNFIENHLPVSLICAVYNKELIFINGNDYYIEYEMLNSKSCHGGDDIMEIINFNLTKSMKNYLLYNFNKKPSSIEKNK